MHSEQIIIVDSPVVQPDIANIANQLSPVLGDSSLLTNVALLYLQHVIYKSHTEVIDFIDALANNIPPDQFILYGMQTTHSSDDLKNRQQFKRQVIQFIEKVIQFYRHSPRLMTVLNQCTIQQCYLVVDRVIDHDDTSPYLQLSIRRI